MTVIVQDDHLTAGASVAFGGCSIGDKNYCHDRIRPLILSVQF